jgi:hypothetical protein
MRGHVRQATVFPRAFIILTGLDTKEKPFSCLVCPKAFTRKYALALDAKYLY